MNTRKHTTLIAAAAATLVALGPAADLAVAEKPQASSPAHVLGPRNARGEENRGGNNPARGGENRGGSNYARGESLGDSRGGGEHYDHGRGGGGEHYDDGYRNDDYRQPDYRHADYRQYHHGGHSRQPRHGHYTYYDTRWNHHHYYPPRGYYYPYVPHGAVLVHHHHRRYYYGGGIWYAPYGIGWSVVAPPIGIFVSMLPPYYSTVWFGGLPYYYANSAYYMYRERERVYEVVDPPYGPDATTVSPAAEDIYVYPRQGQSEEQTAADRYECHRWASDQTGFDPTRADGGVGADQARTARSEYQRAMTACLEGRGYSVR